MHILIFVKNLGKKVRIIHERIWYFTNLQGLIDKI